MMLKELYEWMLERKKQALPYPVDDVSKNALGVPIGKGAGSHALTQSINTAGATANVPAAYAGTELIDINGTTREIPYL